MPVIGNRQSTLSMGKGYANDPIHSYAESFRECAKDILQESGVDIFNDPSRAIMLPASVNALKQFYVNESFDQNEYANCPNCAEMIEDRTTMMEEQFTNDLEAVREHAAMGAYNPVIGMTFPIHKNIMMNNIFDKGAIPKFVAREPKFTISMEDRILIAPDGTEIDMYKDQYKIADAIDSTAPFKKVEMTLPEKGTTDILDSLGATAEDNLSIDTYISDVKIQIWLARGDINPETGKPHESEDGAVDVWLPVKMTFNPNYGEIDRTIAHEFAQEFKDPSPDHAVKMMKDVIVGYTKNNRFVINSTTGVIKAIRLNTRLDTSSAAVKTCSVSWKVRTDIVEIPNAIPINTTVSPEEVKDIGALYNVNQLSKILSLMKTALGEYKDTSIKRHLDNSFNTMPATNKFATTFDFAPRQGYALDHIEWRQKTFMDYLDSMITCLYQVLNDPNMTVSVFGSPELVRKITPTEYTYQTPSNIGPVELDFVKTVVTSDKRVYQFISSDKLRGNPNLIIVLCPRNTDRIIYRIYDYQMYISNEIRNATNPSLPSIHAFERWKFVEYQPVQGRIQILHPTGLTNIAPNTDPIGTTYNNDFNLIK